MIVSKGWDDWSHFAEGFDVEIVSGVVVWYLSQYFVGKIWLE